MHADSFREFHSQGAGGAAEGTLHGHAVVPFLDLSLADGAIVKSLLNLLKGLSFSITKLLAKLDALSA